MNAVLTVSFTVYSNEGLLGIFLIRQSFGKNCCFVKIGHFYENISVTMKNETDNISWKAKKERKKDVHSLAQQL